MSQQELTSYRLSSLQEPTDDMLNSTAAIRQWAQQQIDLRIQQMELDDQETMTIEEAREMTHRAVSREYALDRDMTPEQLYAVISEEIDDIYANG